MLVIHAMLNDSFRGDSENVLAISKEISKQSDFSVVFRYKDNSENIVNELFAKLDQHNQHVLLISGTHGIDLLKNILKDSIMLTMIHAKKLFVAWAGHQPPKNLSDYNMLISVVSLVKESINPLIKINYANKIVATTFAPNTLNEEILTTALNTWHTKNPQPQFQIPESERGYIGVILGGDAPNEKGEQRFYTATEAYAQGQGLAHYAKITRKNVLVTDGPRVYKHYPDSPDSTRPVYTRYKINHVSGRPEWVNLSELSAEERELELEKIATRAHTAAAPINPVSAAFVRGLLDGDLPATRFKYLQFHFDNSAYQALIAALYKTRDKSMAIYTADSISNIEIAFFIPSTFGLLVSNMSGLHGAKLNQFANELSLIGIAKLNDQGFECSTINQNKKQIALESGIAQQDAQNIASFIITKIKELQAKQESKGFMGWLSSMVKGATQTAPVVAASAPVTNDDATKAELKLS